MAEADPEKALRRLQETLNSASEFLSRDLARAERIRQNWGVSTDNEKSVSKNENLIEKDS